MVTIVAGMSIAGKEFVHVDKHRGRMSIAGKE